MPTRRRYRPLLLTCLALGCTSPPPERAGPRHSFQHLVGQFRERAAQKAADGIIVTVAEQLQVPQSSEPPVGLIRVRKETPADPAKDRRGSVTLYEMRFVLAGGEWRCEEATSKDLDGEKVVGENAIRGPDIGFANLILWLGL